MALAWLRASKASTLLFIIILIQFAIIFKVFNTNTTAHSSSSSRSNFISNSNSSSSSSSNFISNSNSITSSTTTATTSTTATVTNTKKKNVVEWTTDSLNDYRALNHCFYGLDAETKDWGVHATTLVTHGTVDKLASVLDLSTKWNGPISAAIFVPKVTMVALQNLKLAVKIINDCKSSSKVSIHLVFPRLEAEKLHLNTDTTFILHQSNAAVASLSDQVKDHDQVNDHDQAKVNDHDQAEDCALQIQNLGILGIEFGKKTANYASNVPYPNNALRNFAKAPVTTDYVLAIDVDMTPAPITLFADFQQHHKKLSGLSDHQSKGSDEDPKVAFVLPAFELRTGALPVLTKRDVIANFNSTVQPFYFDLCWKCQKHSNYDRWLDDTDVGDGDESDSNGYRVEYHDPWEPFYIAKTKDIPPFDERFTQYGFNRISQICEMHMASFDFYVLRSGFVIHHGFKQTGEFHEAKLQEQNKNRLLYRRVKEELKQKFPGQRRCNLHGFHV